MFIMECRSIRKSFGDKVLFDNLSLSVNSNEMVAIVGKSGSGKSTLLNIIGLIEKFDSGELILNEEVNIRINSKKAMLLRRNYIGYVFQNYALSQNDTVYYNLKLATRYDRDKILSISEALEIVGLKDYEKKKVCTLSGGEQQRLAIARVLIKPCKLILADEPTGNLDNENRNLIFSLFDKLINEYDKTIIIVTHDLEIAKKCHKIVSLDNN